MTFPLRTLRRLTGGCSRAYVPAVNFRFLLAIFAALSMLAAPSLAHSAMPSTMPEHHAMDGMGAMEMGHCKAPASKSQGSAPAKSCCLSMCVSAAVAPQAPLAAVEQRQSEEYFSAAKTWHGLISEIATPPPRFA